MHSSRKLIALFACALLGTGGFFSEAAKKEDKPKEADKKKESAKKKDEKKGSEKTAAADDGKGKMTLPLIEGHDAKGLKIPYFDARGNLQMVFTIGVASRLDPDHVKMADLQVETFGDDGEREMTIELPASVLDLNTRVLSSKTPVTIRRDDFEITGQSMEFNTKTKQGELAGNVRMLIFDLEGEAAPAPAVQPQQPARE